MPDKSGNNQFYSEQDWNVIFANFCQYLMAYISDILKILVSPLTYISMYTVCIFFNFSLWDNNVDQFDKVGQLENENIFKSQG